jgi:FkbM family methyltransferase
MSNAPTVKQELVRLRRTLCERLGSARYSRPALYDLDRKLEKVLSFRAGFFVELGANDGFNQSNTYFLERWRGWRGILIEAIPELYHRAVAQRPRARVFNCACVAFDYPDPEVQMSYANLMSVVKGSWHDPKLEAEHVATGQRLENITRPVEVRVPARTLTSILDECGVSSVDFLSLDVEGYEAAVLRGLDLSRHAPRYILVEARYPDDLDDLLLDRYDKIDQLTELDVLYRLKTVQ